MTPASTPDRGDRKCVKCKETFTPYNVGLSDSTPQIVTVKYVCLSCRMKGETVGVS